MGRQVPYMMELEQVVVDESLDQVASPHPRRSRPVKALGPGSGAARRASFRSQYTPMSGSIHTAAWKRPSHTMFCFRASSEAGGSTAEPMLCQWKIWCRRIPSTNPPRPRPRMMPARWIREDLLSPWGGLLIIFQPRERGETGRRAGLRILSRKGWGFNSPRSHS